MIDAEFLKFLIFGLLCMVLKSLNYLHYMVIMISKHSQFIGFSKVQKEANGPVLSSAPQYPFVKT